MQFPASLRLQKSKQEGIAGLSDMFIDIERLQAFRRRSNVLSKRMIIFRDGVSEGQYEKVIGKPGSMLHAQRVGISLSSGGGGGAGSSSGGAVMNSEEFLKFRAEQHKFAYQQVNLYSRYPIPEASRRDTLRQEKASSAQIRARLDNIGREHGDAYVEGIQPVFDALKVDYGLGIQRGDGGATSTTQGGPAGKSSEPFPLSTIAGVLNGRNLAARLCRGFSYFSSGGALRGLEPVTNADCDRSGRLDGMRGENRSTGACGYTWRDGRVPTVMNTAERVDITLGCSVVRKSSGLQALMSQMGACATVVVTGGDDGMAWT